MTDEQMRIAIAEACGWKGISHEHLTGYAPWRPTPYIERVMGDLDNIPIDPLPDYLNDLNAMHEAECVLIGLDGGYWRVYQNQVHIAAGLEMEIHATARQRAEAFLRTLNLWKP